MATIYTNGDLASMDRSTLEALVAQLANKPAKALSVKVSDKGGVSVYGLGRFPVTLYAGQWERLLGMANEIKAFIVANEANMSRKA